MGITMLFGRAPNLPWWQLQSMTVAEIADYNRSFMVEVKMSDDGGYCTKCNTVWANPGICNCKEVEMSDDKKLSEKMNDEEFKKFIKLDQDIWNDAIEAAAKVANNWNLYCEEEIRSLKK